METSKPTLTEHANALPASEHFPGSPAPAISNAVLGNLGKRGQCWGNGVSVQLLDKIA